MWLAVARSEDLPLGSARSVRARRRRIAVLRTPAGDVRGMADTCPHRGAALGAGDVCRMVEADGVGRYRLSDGVVLRCPWHAYEFDVESGDSVMRDPKLHVMTYATKEEGGMIFVDVPLAVG